MCSSSSPCRHDAVIGTLLIAADPVGPPAIWATPPCFDGHPVPPLAPWPSSDRSWHHARAEIPPPATPLSLYGKAPSIARRLGEEGWKWYNPPWRKTEELIKRIR